MLAANEAVAEHLDRPGRRRSCAASIPPPEPTKLKAFAEFARILGYKIERETDRFALQRILRAVGRQARGATPSTTPCCAA